MYLLALCKPRLIGLTPIKDPRVERLDLDYHFDYYDGIRIYNSRYRWEFIVGLVIPTLRLTYNDESYDPIL